MDIGHIKNNSYFYLFISLQKEGCVFADIIKSCIISSYDELLLKSMLATLEVQRYRFIATEVYQAVNKLSPIYIKELFETKDLVYNLRDPIRTKVPK